MKVIILDIENIYEKERVLIAGIYFDKEEIGINNSMDELQELVEEAGGEVVLRVIQKKDHIDSAFFVGRGKVEEIRNYCEDLKIDTVAFNDELSGAQIKNLEDAIERKVIDRTNLILDIFARRAATKEGKLQVKLAQLQYMLPRLIGMRDYLSREGGGIGTRGPGEQKLETDRRHVLREITNIEKQLKSIEKIREVKRKKRLASNLPIVALVGYTNAGKSTLLNKILEISGESSVKDVFAYDMLFATLDVSYRRAKLPKGQYFLITDTVGFINKLPVKLVEAFKGTLEEIKYADLLLHVVDVSNRDVDIQIKTTYNILKEMGVIDKPIITVLNKIDKVDIYNTYYDQNIVKEKVFISAEKKINLGILMDTIEKMIPQKFFYVALKIPYDKQNLLSNICENYNTENLKYEEDGVYLNVSLNSIDFERYKEYILF
ncbi:GTPase HflX [Acidilutibacter cellobiosedens]|uniref:GTPase HflX n=1 Tax=Acidilutibacter cellobiosedens TaxID=2507161 RepID=A0A410QDP5_9FIRM|nr:GTPase HflX [Acidilutibacter cellobiosedens]MBE6081361.1 GTPase HflX [Tissierellaceae bacterium]QAT62111.1 GTPase HflX [Acidilutibacter cellobiosedens]